MYLIQIVEGVNVVEAAKSPFTIAFVMSMMDVSKSEDIKISKIVDASNEAKQRLRSLLANRISIEYTILTPSIFFTMKLINTAVLNGQLAQLLATNYNGGIQPLVITEVPKVLEVKTIVDETESSKTSPSDTISGNSAAIIGGSIGAGALLGIAMISYCYFCHSSDSDEEEEEEVKELTVEHPSNKSESVWVANPTYNNTEGRHDSKVLLAKRASQGRGDQLNHKVSPGTTTTTTVSSNKSNRSVKFVDVASAEEETKANDVKENKHPNASTLSMLSTFSGDSQTESEFFADLNLAKNEDDKAVAIANLVEGDDSSSRESTIMDMDTTTNEKDVSDKKLSSKKQLLSKYFFVRNHSSFSSKKGSPLQSGQSIRTSAHGKSANKLTDDGSKKKKSSTTMLSNYFFVRNNGSISSKRSSRMFSNNSSQMLSNRMLSNRSSRMLSNNSGMLSNSSFGSSRMLSRNSKLLSDISIGTVSSRYSKGYPMVRKMSSNLSGITKTVNTSSGKSNNSAKSNPKSVYYWDGDETASQYHPDDDGQYTTKTNVTTRDNPLRLESVDHYNADYLRSKNIESKTAHENSLLNSNNDSKTTKSTQSHLESSRSVDTSISGRTIGTTGATYSSSKRSRPSRKTSKTGYVDTIRDKHEKVSKYLVVQKEVLDAHGVQAIVQGYEQIAQKSARNPKSQKQLPILEKEPKKISPKNNDQPSWGGGVVGEADSDKLDKMQPEKS